MADPFIPPVVRSPGCRTVESGDGRNA